MNVETCTATSKRSGLRCKRAPVPGAKVCKIHGGGAPQVRAAAARRVEKAQRDGEIGRLLARLGQDEVPDLIEGLLDAVKRCAQMVAVYGLVLAGRDALGWNRFDEQVADPAVVEYRAWLAEYARATKLALDAGIDERQTRVSELDVARLFDAVGGALADAGLSGEQSAAFRRSLAGRLRSLGTDTA